MTQDQDLKEGKQSEVFCKLRGHVIVQDTSKNTAYMHCMVSLVTDVTRLKHKLPIPHRQVEELQ